MLTKGDDYPIHQTAEPIAYAGTDRNFYDRYFFNGYSPDGSLFFAVAFGVYPHLNIADAHFSVVKDGVQHCLHASTVLHMERLNLKVGPISITVLEALQTLKVTVEAAEGLSAELLFEGRAFPIEEPRFMRRLGPRSFFDYTRMTQNGRYSGWIDVDGARTELPVGTVGTRDRSWGTRPIGSSDPQPHVPAVDLSFFWQWTPMNFPTRSVFWHTTEDMRGVPWNRRGALVPDGVDHIGIIESEDAHMETELREGTRHPAGGSLAIAFKDGTKLAIRFEPLVRFQMLGIGYLHPRWRHGAYQGELVVERENILLDEIDLTAPEHYHVQMLSRVTLTEGPHVETGLGVFEQAIQGPYQPLGLDQGLGSQTPD